MWIFLNNAFLSIVDPKASYAGGNGPVGDKILVRARFKGDLERVFSMKEMPALKIEETPDRDYRFRVLVPREVVVAMIAVEIRNIDYSNFKGSTAEKWRHDAYMGCWSVMEREQRRQAMRTGEPGRRRSDELFKDDSYFTGRPARRR